ncbi:hypothetical protein [Krasilnikovia sp. MM14-A1259]|uniref:hypothetical protein n=1 Tax=Krasilnikovia sp. MM14-A1259 TaxID=3373539 RepID=UPI0037F447C0
MILFDIFYPLRLTAAPLADSGLPIINDSFRKRTSVRDARTFEPCDVLQQWPAERTVDKQAHPRLLTDVADGR